MSRLYFTPVDKAFTLGSSQIKDTQEEIANLTKLILEANDPLKQSKSNLKHEMEPEIKQNQFTSIGPSDKFTQNANDDLNLLKIMAHPKFDDIVQTYLSIKSGGNLKETKQLSNFGKNQFNFKKFGNKYQETVLSEVTRYLVFYVVCIIIFMLLSVFMKLSWSK